MSGCRSTRRLQRFAAVVLATVSVLVVLPFAHGAGAATRPLVITSVAPAWSPGAYQNHPGFTVRWRLASAAAVPDADFVGALALPVGAIPPASAAELLSLFFSGVDAASSYAMCAQSPSAPATCQLFGSGSTALLPSTMYSIYVLEASTTSGAAVMTSSTTAATTGDPRPGAPSSVTALPVLAGTGLAVSWTQSSVAVGGPLPSYVVNVVGADAEPGATPVTCAAVGSRPRCRVTGLAADGSYEVTVTATSAFGEATSDPITVALDPKAPPSVAVSAGSTHDATSVAMFVDASWRLSADEGRVPTISYSASFARADDPDHTTVSSCDAAVGLHRCRSAALAPSTAYVVTVVAANALGSNSITSEVVTTPDLAVPATPAGIATSVNGGTDLVSPSIRLQWTASANRRSIPTLTYFALALPATSVPPSSAAEVFSVIVSGASSETSWAMCAVGASSKNVQSCTLQGSGATALLTLSSYRVFLVASYDNGSVLSVMADPIVVSTPAKN